MLGIGFRVFALWCLVQVLFVAPQMYSSTFYALHEGSLSPTRFYFMTTVFMVVGLCLVAAIVKLGAQASKLATSHGVNTGLDSEFERMLYQLLGVFLVVSAFAVIPGSSARAILDFGQTDRSWVNVAWLTGYVLQLILGAWLVTKPARWAGLLSRLREAGH